MTTLRDELHDALNLNWKRKTDMYFRLEKTTAWSLICRWVVLASAGLIVVWSAFGRPPLWLRCWVAAAASTDAFVVWYVNRRIINPIRVLQGRGNWLIKAFREEVDQYMKRQEKEQ